MHKVLGLLMLAVGLAYLIGENAPSPAEREEQVAALTRIVARATIIEPETVPAEIQGLRRPVGSATASSLAPARTNTAAAPSAAETVTLSSTAPSSDPSDRTDSPNVQRQLARAIQTELKRVGCYSGRLDGSWGDRSRDAMATFIARVNASLPMNEPDVFLLSLVKGQTSRVCGDNNETVLATNRPAAEPKAGSQPADTETVTVASRPDPLPGRMSIGGPVPPQASATPPPVTDWTAPADERLPWQSEAINSAPAPQMAALEPADSNDDVSVMPRPARKIVKMKRASAPPKVVKRRYSSSRSVQQIFMHPLGRM